MNKRLRWAGSLLAIGGIVFVALGLREHAAAIDLTRIGSADWLMVMGLALVYGVASLLLALGWWNLLGQFGTRLSLGWAIRVYGISQIAKYLPGNIMHLAGRQTMGMAAGVPGWTLAKSAVWELALIAAVGALFGGLALPLVVEGFPAEAGTALFLGMVSVAFVLVWRSAGPSAARALVAYAVFLAISGGLFVALVDVASAGFEWTGTLLWFPVVGAYVLAWLAGLLTPGAPAGVGVRELVLLVLLKGVIGEIELLLAVLLSRLVTALGDVLFFGMALLGDRKSPRQGA
ncbi:hypothetical protein [Thioalkalivibrio paradoxus]|uniref:Lysylphosphatidylglycerol synthetase n=1 Tax=Thioalkalivibrio paradoxus ARh 1 TaxID=713585 RepID=W0DIR8_9GAMM|nr:hypothetical protein [Thioalkalivibrio paradoxus]AHE98509.1 hypothetical protein THITH_09845 [Thioalkalivibrio paradoxus ARh 1]